MKADDLKLGLLLGFLAPFTGLIGFYFWKFTSLKFMEFIQYLGIEKHLITGVASFSLMANAILFTIFVNSQKDQTAKGIFIVTCLYGVGILLLKFVFV